jgi:hypothetical protein
MSNFVEVVEIEELDYVEDVYDITVEDNHNFFANGMLVHNCLGGPLCFDVFEHLQKISFDDLKYNLLDDDALFERILTSMGNTYDKLSDAVGKENVCLEIQFSRHLEFVSLVMDHERDFSGGEMAGSIWKWELRVMFYLKVS